MNAFDRNEAAAARAGNQVYYFEVGHGVWRGTFRFRVTSWRDFRVERISFREVHARERFGPIPFLFRNEKEHPAEIERGGLRSTYYMPLLGTDWVARYQVHSDRKRIEGRLSCPWAEATEAMDKLPG